MFLREGTVESSEWGEIYFWQHSSHGAAVELFTLITSPLMPAAVWNQSGPSGPAKPLMWRAFVVWWGLLHKKWNIVTGFFRISQLPPTSLVAYKNRVIVCICVFLSVLEITVINQCDIGLETSSGLYFLLLGVLGYSYILYCKKDLKFLVK